MMGRFFRGSTAFFDELAEALRGKRVLEIFAGNGLLAGFLATRGIAVTATSVLSGMDAHDRGFYHPVIEMNALEAVSQYGHEHDVLLLCWPTVNMMAIQAVREWTAMKNEKDALAPIAYIGEVTDYAKNRLGGCATDEFFEEVIPDRRLLSYEGNVLEQAFLGHHRSAIQHARRPSAPGGRVLR